ncbi:MAG: M15 family metallopeptidase [Candidatus Hydrogenedentes bacterium]|nr:M15 family metallopeptidase [Candidatus Hydrogenedentota bacterium]
MNRHQHVFRRALVALCVAGAICSSCTTTGEPAAQQTELVELIDVVPDILLDLRYATDNNFTGKVVYPVARCFLVRDAALALRDVQADLRPLGYRLKVFDGYRPLSVQRRFWEILPDPQYVADPRIGSRHNRGYAVDLTIVDLDGNDAAMPTEFDDFTERAHRNSLAASAEAIGHREILEITMVRHGFIPFPTEWWHFDYRGYEDKPNLDIPLDALE